MRSLIACSAVVLSVAFSTAKAQDLQRDILAGHITGPSGAVAGAMVSVTPGRCDRGRGATDRSHRHRRPLARGRSGRLGQLRRSRDGHRDEAGTDDRQAWRAAQADHRRHSYGSGRRVARRSSRHGGETSATAARESARRSASGSDRPTDGFRGRVAVGDQGNLASMAASVPGVTLVPDASGGLPGFSVLGLSPDQNRITLNGLSFGGGDIPRDALVMTRVASTSFDVSRGGFSGGQLSVSANSGGNFTTRLAHVTLRRPVAPGNRRRRPAARRAVHERAAQRRRGRPDRSRQAVLQPRVSGRAAARATFSRCRRATRSSSQRVGVAQDSVSRCFPCSAAKAFRCPPPPCPAIGSSTTSRSSADSIGISRQIASATCSRRCDTTARAHHSSAPRPCRDMAATSRRTAPTSPRRIRRFSSGATSTTCALARA